MSQEISFGAAFIAGILSFFSPCVLPLVPAYIANLAGSTAIEPGARSSRIPALLHSICFVIGFSIIFVLLGASVGLLGTVITAHADILRIIAGVLITLMGLFIILAFKIPWFNYEKRIHFSPSRNPGYIRSVLIGMAFALGWTPCVGPVLGAILALAWSSQNVGLGARLLIVYSLGMGIPFILIGLAWGAVMPLWKNINKHLGLISIISGILLIIIGILILTNNFAWISMILPS
ncbi:MAG TPA: cytochrome c biogenesis protein CcdA [Dehalococcoidia bacterium]|nr:cytochrome c biogenesis protein CcdA [Dehalococcoidia bacterium]